MHLTGHLLRLIRWQNLLFIAITQALFHYCIAVPASRNPVSPLPVQLANELFWWLVAASVLIAGAGYIINDYFDINIDEVNKPEKMVVDKIIRRRYAILLHGLLSATGVIISMYVALQLKNPLIIIGNLLCVSLLWLYSTTYKRRLLIGNVLISLMTSWVILVLLLAELPGWLSAPQVAGYEKTAIARLTRIGMLYAAFAFIISLIREVVKDMEDMEGDRRENCKTLPLVFGINAARVFAGTWLFILITVLVITQGYVLLFGWWLSALYIILLVAVPLGFIFRDLFRASVVSDYTRLSSRLKWVMLSGILSMLFFLYYSGTL